MVSRYRPQLRTILLLVNLLILLLPIGGVGLLKMYESELIKQTESALIGQAALLSAIYAKELFLQAESEKVRISSTANLPADSPFHSFGHLTPIHPHLDVATASILSPSPDGLSPTTPPDRVSLEVGTQLRQVLHESQRITLCGIRILDSNGVVVSSSGTELGLSLANRQEVRTALQGYYSSVLRKRISDEPVPLLSSLSRKSWVRVVVAMPVIHDQKVVGAVVLSRSPLGVGKGLYLLRKHLFLAGFVILSLVILITWLTNAVISRPLKKLVGVTKDVEVHGGNLAPLKNPGTFEVAELSKSIAEMAHSLQTRSDYIENFARHVSHEFKTPITSLHGSIELMQDMESEMSDEERSRFLGNMAGDVQHLEGLTRGLLDLARADMITPGEDSCEPETVAQQLAEHYHNSNLDVRATTTAELKSVVMNAEILRGILVNLVENSVRHGMANLVTISIETHRDKNTIQALITVTDNGIGIQSANRDKIFTPFFTTARNRGGTGLGLAITKALVEGSGGTIWLDENSDDTTRFQILLPLKQE